MISASFINHTLTQPVARVAEIADAKEKAAKDRAVRVLTPVVADRFGISTCYVGEVRREFKEKQEEKSEF